MKQVVWGIETLRHVRSQINRRAIAITAVVLAFGVLSSCGLAPPDLAMKVERQNSGPLFLLGSFRMYPYGRRTALVHLRGKDLECEGASSGAVRMNKMRETRGDSFLTRGWVDWEETRHTVRISCSDGRTGTVVIDALSEDPVICTNIGGCRRFYGTGFGRLSDGTKVEVGLNTHCNDRKKAPACHFEPIPRVGWATSTVEYAPGHEPVWVLLRRGTTKSQE